MTGHIYINGQIGSSPDTKGVELIDVISQVESQKQALEFIVHINSYGGSVHVGYQIHDYLKSLKQRVITSAENFCASMATVIHQAGVEKHRLPDTPYIIHNPRISIEKLTEEYLQSHELQYMADDMKQSENEMIAFYAKATGLSKDAIAPLMLQETSLTDEQSIQLGFVTHITPRLQAVAFLTNKKEDEMSKVILSKLDSIAKHLFGKTDEEAHQPVAMSVTSADGTLLVFERTEGEITVGDAVTLEGGAAAEGEYVMPDGSKLVVEGGLVKDIIPAAAPEPVQDNVEQMKAELESIKAEFESYKATAEAEKAEVEKKVAEFEARAVAKSSYQVKAQAQSFKKPETAKSFSELREERKNNYKK